MSTDTCFNEAPIHESGKFPFLDIRGDRIAASMRPRFMNRGSGVGLASKMVRATRFNEAPIHESGKCGVVVAATGETGGLQ